MKINRYILPLAMAVYANAAISEDYGWYYSPHAVVGPFISPAELCSSLGASVKDMEPRGLVSWGGIPASGSCGDPTGGLVFFRLGDSCPDGNTYDYHNMSCEKPEPEPKNEDCENGIKDIDGQCSPKSPIPDPNNKNTCGGDGGPSEYAGNPVLIATGQKVELVTDLEIPNSLLSFTRNYWSSRLDTSSVGLAWQHNWQMSIKQLQSRERIKLYRNNGRGIIFTPYNGVWKSDGSDTEVITKLPDTQGWKVQTATGETEYYNSQGQLISYEKHGYPTVTLNYNANKQLISLTDTKGRSFTLTYNTKNLITQITASNGSSISYTYDTKNRLTSLSKDSNTKKYHYENTQFTQLLTGITDERGIRYASWSYNDKGQAITSEHTGGADKYTFEYLPNNQTRITNPLGKTSLYTFQDIRLEKKIKSIEGEALNTCIGTNRTFRYNAEGLVVSEITENGSEKKYQYNDRGLEIQRDFIKSNGPLYKTITTKWHDTLPLPLEINNTGQRQSFQYDTNGRLIEYTNGFKDLSELNQGQDIALLQFNDFTDEAGNIWETVGNPQIVDDPDAVTGKALYLDGKSHLFTTIDKFQFGKGDFTIEFRFKVKPRVSSSDAYGFVGTKNAGTPDSSIGIYAMNSFPTGAMVYHAYQSHTPATGQVHGYPANLNILDNKWHHIAYVRKNNVLTVYYDGISRLTINDPTTYQFEPESTIFRLGNTLEGYLDQVRIAKKAIYTENFAPTNVLNSITM